MAQSILDRVEKYRTVVWDWNGTLIDDSRIAIDVEAELFPRYGVKPLTYEERRNRFCFPIEKYYERMGFDFSKHSYADISVEWLEIYERAIRRASLFQGAFEMLDCLKTNGKRQFLLSAAPQDHLEQAVEKHGIKNFFEGIYALDDAKAGSKLYRGIQMMENHQINASESILIGDTSHDLEVGHALKMDVLLVADGHHAFEELAKLHDNVLQTRFIR